MKRNKQYWIRKTHRYLGLFIGIQFLGWTVSGLFFSWNDLDSVHGDHFKKPVPSLTLDSGLVSPDQAWQKVDTENKVDSLRSIQLISILGKPTYQISYYTSMHDHSNHEDHAMVQFALVNAQTGKSRARLNEEDAIAIARQRIVNPATVSQVQLLEEVGPHHEIRGRHLPMWAVTFSDPSCTVYVSPDQGTYQTIRHDQWRIFDFLWMFHTMDYAGRDDFNNWLLKIISVFGLLTICSGFTLYFMSSRSTKNLINKLRTT